MPIAVTCTDVDAARKHLARIRCLKECIECLRENKPFPEAIAYVPARIEYRSEKNTKISIYGRPSKSAKKLSEFVCSPEHSVWLSGEELCNSDGQWARFIKATVRGSDVNVPESLERWLLLYSYDVTASASSNILVPVHRSTDDKKLTRGETLDGKRPEMLDNWLDVVEHEYAIRLSKDCTATPADVDAVERLRRLPMNWSIQQDEDLAQFLGKQVDSTSSTLGSIKDYVDAIEVSSKSHRDGEENLTDGNANTYWESDGTHGTHWIRLRMKKGVVIRKLLVTVDGGEGNYVPSLIHVMGGSSVDSLRKLNEVTVDQGISDINDVLILSDQTEFFALIEIRIKECKGHGIDTKVHGLKIKSDKDGDVGVNRDLFVKANLVRFPKLESFDQELIYRRALLLGRMMRLFDSVLVYIVPLWDYSAGTYASMEVIRQLLPLSQKRMQLVEQFLSKTEMSVGHIQKLYLNRRSALDHRADPSLDPEYKNSIFTQIYEGLKPKDLTQSPLHYRWGTRTTQWWECKFFGEGVIDQGGGFRDSISDLSEELCPSNSDDPIATPFFIRTPNQKNEDASGSVDMYIPNPSCKEFQKFEWIGKLMGACLRGKEFLVLSLPPIFWKQLANQPVSWSKDFSAVDAFEVKSLRAIKTMGEEEFNKYPRTWTTTLSDGTLFNLKPAATSEGGAAVDVVPYSVRNEYVELVKDARMNESKKQIEAIQRGLLQVIPQAVLELLTCQELDKRSCGDPEISMDALRRYVHLEDIDKDAPLAKHLWAALENFSNADRSRFIRFVTGRRRLPAHIKVVTGSNSQSSHDALPSSSTCASTLILPNYQTARIMEDKLRYAIYNCVSIDTDTSPYDED